MTTSAIPPVKNTKAPEKPRCWFEVALKPWAQVEADGHPDRIWDSADERWAGIERSGKPVVGSLILGYVKEMDGEFVPKSLRVIHSLQVNWMQGLEMMRYFEANGDGLWENVMANNVREIEDARKNGQADLANQFVAAIQALAASNKAQAVSK